MSKINTYEFSNISVSLDPPTLKALTDLAIRLSQSRSGLVRLLIRREWEKQLVDTDCPEDEGFDSLWKS
jgi:hypothetical protein